jgi:N-methylhydantoinase A
MQREIASILPGIGTPIVHRAADLRYLGQEHSVTVTVGTCDEWPGLRERFDDAHHQAYGYAARDVEAQLLNLRLTVAFPLERPRLPTHERGQGAAVPIDARKVYSAAAGDFTEHRVFAREHLRPGQSVEGPAAVEEAGTTTIIDAGDVLEVETHGCLIIEVAREGGHG